MTEEQINHHKQIMGLHRVNVFSMYTMFRFLKICCPNCKFQQQCKNEKLKRENCMAAKDTEKMLESHVAGWASSFQSDDFFLKKTNKKDLKHTIELLEKKYLINQYVRN